MMMHLGEVILAQPTYTDRAGDIWYQLAGESPRLDAWQQFARGSCALCINSGMNYLAPYGSPRVCTTCGAAGPISVLGGGGYVHLSVNAGGAQPVGIWVSIFAPRTWSEYPELFHLAKIAARIRHGG